MRLARIALAATVMSGFTGMAYTQTPVPRERSLLITSTVGADMFKVYCSNCHGLDAKGRPAASAAAAAAPSLTTLARQHGGVFPRERVREIITHGSGSPGAHGPTAMPVWGAIFRGLETQDTVTQIRIDNLVQYLESIQDEAARLGDQ
jgi:mono/diheme cytochrome c family protein